MTAPDDPALVAEAVSRRFTTGERSVRALDGASLTVRRGTVTGLIGPDGAGKTTLMRIAAGLLRPDAGRVTVLGLDAAEDALAVQAALGYMPQHFGLYEDLSVQENLDLYADLQGLARAERPDRYEALMRMTGLGPFTARLAGRLSGGMKQKLGLACALVRPQALLLLDEPTVGVDPVSRRELWRIVYRLVEDEGTTVLLSTAYLDEAERCAEVVLLHEGRVIGQGPPDTFSERMRGRTYALPIPADTPKRRLQTRLAATEGVVDAIIHHGRVRLVLAPDADPARVTAGAPAPEASAPRFEDYFVDALGGVEPARDHAADEPRAGGDGEVAIEVAHAQRRFGDFLAVRDVSFDVRRGEVFGLLGANGAGKSTTFRMLCGLLPASDGRLRVAGVDLRRARAAARQRIGYMSQKFSLYGNLRVIQNLEFFAAAYGIGNRERRARIDRALETFELAAHRDATSGDLPLGYKQRLALACALMHEPEILFLDEPTSGVDPLARREFWARINALAEAGVTVLVTTHFLEEAEYCDRLAIMAAGEILSLGTPAEIKAATRDDAQPDPSMEDAFIALIERREAEAAA